MPEDLAPDELTVEKAEELLAGAAGDRELGTDPATGRAIVAKAGRYGPYVTEVLPEDAPKSAKPRTGVAVQGHVARHGDARRRAQLLTLPRVVGADPETGDEITAQNGRYGPYLKKGTDSRSLETEDQLFTITLREALAIYAQPKQRGRAAARRPLRELGADPVSGRRSWSRTAASGPTSPTARPTRRCARATPSRRSRMERAVELLAEKRAKGPAPKKRAAKKAPAKKAAAKKAASGADGVTTKKTAAKRTAAKKVAAKA